MNEILGPRFEEALAYACVVHADQRRKGGDIPYIAHLLAVASLVIEDGAAAGELREDEAIAGLLHDAAEDRGGERRLADIEARFGPRVAEIVRACSDSLAEDPSDKTPWRERKERYLAHLVEETDPGIIQVSLADKVHNARSILADQNELGDALWKRFHGDANTPWYYRELARIFSEKVPESPLARDLKDTVAKLPGPPQSRAFPAVVVHADWGKNTKKRSIARARRSDDGWNIEAIQAWSPAASALESLGVVDEGGPILVGADFPIGLPRVHAEAAGIESFTEMLPEFGHGRWAQFYEVATTADEISTERPFYPQAASAKGLVKREHLEKAHGTTYEALLRRCEKANADHGAACCLFWTLGANQVGKGAIAGWQELVVPLMRDENAGVWPFDGRLADLVTTRRVTVAETYPAEYYVPLGFPRAGWGKTRQPGRVGRAEAILSVAKELGADLAPEVKALIEDGFGSSTDGEDPFDAVVGLLGMLMALRDGSEAPQADSVQRVEGWILGQPATEL